MKPQTEKNVIVKHLAGSISYGTNLPTSDRDVRGLFCADREFMTTPFFNCKEINLDYEEDGKLYEIATFMQLYTDCNPNIIETLWVDEKHILEKDDYIYSVLRKNAEALLSSKVAFRYSGYAHAQLKRIKGHNKWINNPQPVDKPQMKDHVKMIQNFTEGKIFDKDFDINKVKDCALIHFGNNIYGIVEEGSHSVLDKSGEFNVCAKQESCHSEHRKTPLFLIKFCEDEYKRAKENHKNYWTWKNNRNEVRAAMEADYGFDGKHGMHLVRLMRMAEEILTGQGVKVFRSDADELLAIRNGDWKYEDLIKYADEKDAYIREVLYPQTSLRKKPNIKLAASILMNIQDYYWTKDSGEY